MSKYIKKDNFSTVIQIGNLTKKNQGIELNELISIIRL